MDKLDKNLIIEIALNLSLSDIVKFCQTSKNIKKWVCDSRDFWNRKLYDDLGETSPNPKERYRFIYWDSLLYSDFGITSNNPKLAYKNLNKIIQKEYDIYPKISTTFKSFKKSIVDFIMGLNYKEKIGFITGKFNLDFLIENFIIDNYPKFVFSKRKVDDVITLFTKLILIRLHYNNDDSLL